MMPAPNMMGLRGDVHVARRKSLLGMLLTMAAARLG